MSPPPLFTRPEEEFLLKPNPWTLETCLKYFTKYTWKLKSQIELKDI